jgi:hypothetical protein
LVRDLEDPYVELLLGMLQGCPDLLFEFSDALSDCPLALVLADVTPSALYVRHRTRVDCLCVGCTKLKKHRTIESLAIEDLWPCLLEDLQPQCVDLLLKFWPEV